MGEERRGSFQSGKDGRTNGMEFESTYELHDINN